MSLPLNGAALRRHWPHLAVYGCLILFWGLSLWKLDRYPAVNDDEPWTVLPGYSLFSRGVFGSPSMAGYYGMNRLYLQAPPLMYVLLGASASALGFGVWQMRFLPVVLGAVTIALCFHLGRRWMGGAAGALAALMLIFWRWMPAGPTGEGSGILLLDVARIARYDILTAPLGLGALACFWRASQTQTANRRWGHFLAGLLVGLAGLAHYYGLFWLAVFGVLLMLRVIAGQGRLLPVIQDGLWLLGGVAALWGPWAVVIAANWPQFSGQTLIYRGHFQLLSPGFYLRNLLQEGQRYFPGGQASLAGAVLLSLFAPAVALWLTWRFARTRDIGLAWLWAPALIFSVLFASLVQQKNTSYLVSFIAVVALLVAYAGQRLLASRQAVVRALAAVGLVLIVGQGALGIGQMLQGAAQADAPGPFFARLRQTVTLPGLILGPLKYSFPFEGRDFRAIEIMYYLALTTSHQMSAPDSFEGALQMLRPRYVLLDEVIWQSLTETELAGSAGRNASFWNYLSQHGGQLAAAVRDNNGHMVRVYQLDP